MKTKYLDSEIKRMNLLERNNELSDYGKKALNELKDIKKQLTLTDVVKSFVCGECGHDKKAVNTTLGKICCARCRSFVAN